LTTAHPTAGVWSDGALKIVLATAMDRHAMKKNILVTVVVAVVVGTRPFRLFHS
jgi:hypothetical protein